MLELAKREVDGLTYEFEQFGAKRATKLLVRLSKIIGKPLTLGIAAAQGKSLAEVQLTSDVLAPVVDALFANLDSDEVQSILEAFTADEKVLCDGKKVFFDKHYEGRLDHMLRVFWAALEVQYGNFFGAVLTLRGAAAAPTGHQKAT